mmetsp:Transcript_20004/g.63870  ORF Transcript_20004/g.63870 Transcript_20004/m.63870 type:complete len:201 (+) Transcript_20004:755-1357(+)
MAGVGVGGDRAARGTWLAVDGAARLRDARLAAARRATDRARGGGEGGVGRPRHKGRHLHDRRRAVLALAAFVPAAAADGGHARPLRPQALPLPALQQRQARGPRRPADRLACLRRRGARRRVGDSRRERGAPLRLRGELLRGDVRLLPRQLGRAFAGGAKGGQAARLGLHGAAARGSGRHHLRLLQHPRQTAPLPARRLP